VACELLQGWGAYVDVALNGQQALEMLENHVPDHYAAVLMDIEMPVMDGREATRRLRADHRYDALPIIAMTAHVVGHGMRDVVEEGITGFIAKPFEPDVLLNMLQGFWQKEQAALSEQAVSLPSASEQRFAAALSTVFVMEATVLLRRFSGRIPFLSRALRRFADDIRGWTVSLAELLAKGDKDAARRQVHTLKGLSGTFAMPDLQAVLSALESAVSEARDCRTELDGVRARLAALIEALDSLPVVDQSDSGETVLEPLSEVIERLRQHLREGDGEAEELWRQHKGRMSIRYGSRQAGAIGQAIGNWNFAEAQSLLDQAENSGGHDRE
jgi:two-component system sensor histidine kinase/response regulator